MKVLGAIGLGILFVVGASVGVVLGVVVVFWVSLYRGKRAVHAEGVVCRGEVIAKDPEVGPRLAGPALVRLSGAFEDQQTTGTDVLGLDLRLQRSADVDPGVGDQDLLMGTFESFRTAQRDRASTDAGDYLGNRYSTVTPWWIPGDGPVIIRLTPPPAQSRDRGVNRIARLDADLDADRAAFVMMIQRGSSTVIVAELRLIERLPIDDRSLRASMFRQGRGVRPVGFRNGIRATVYPISQIARRLRGG